MQPCVDTLSRILFLQKIWPNRAILSNKEEVVRPLHFLNNNISYLTICSSGLLCRGLMSSSAPDQTEDIRRAVPT